MIIGYTSCGLIFILRETIGMMRLFFLAVCISSCAENAFSATIADTIPSKYDSSLLQLLIAQESIEDNAVLISEQEGGNTTTVVSPLYAEKDVFLQMAAFQFSAMRYRYRGYEASHSGALINGLLFNDLQQGQPAWSLWNGLSPMMRNSTDVTANRFQDNWIGNSGITSYTDMRVLVQRKQLQWGYGNSNRNYSHRYHFSYATETNRSGWSWALATNIRLSAENYRTGSAYLSGAYYAAVDKQFRKAGLLSCIIFGSKQRYGKQAAITADAATLLGYTYNPNWGYQQGRKRNAALVEQHFPTVILSYEMNPDNQSAWITSAAFITGQRTDTGLDWCQAADPRPDYYRYWPQYQTDSILGAQITEAILLSTGLQQINWQALYTINRHAHGRIDHINGTNESLSGKRARYLLEQRVVHTNRWLLSSFYKARWKNNWNIAAGIQINHQQNHQYKKVYDLLGADFHVNWNQFAESDFPTNVQAVQFDLDHPNRILRVGNKYGYDYLSSIMFANTWITAAHSGRKMDYFFGIRFSKTEFKRKGLVRNGLFPSNSKGNSSTSHFFDPLVKGGLTYKLNTKHQLFFLFQLQSKAPLFDNVFIAPSMRNTKQEQPTSETVLSMEASYRLMLRALKVNASIYQTNIKNGMNVLRFYHDGYRNFVNYAVSNIDRRYMGIELSIAYTFSEKWEWTLSYAKGIYQHTNRQTVAVSLDHNEILLNRMEVYSKNFRIAGSPQQVAGTGIRYRTPQNFFFQANANFYDDSWLEFNPVRRTYEALEGITKGSEQWYKVINQVKLPSAMLVNLFAGKGFAIRNVYQKKSLRFFLTAGITNLLNKKNNITGGYEQLRFDQETKNPDRFPPKLFYGDGMNYTLAVSMTF